MYAWIIEDKLAISPLPPMSSIPVLAKVFNAVVILVEPHELHGFLDYYLDTWRVNGVETYYAPTPDFHPVDLFELYRISEWIDNKLSRGWRVLIHCMGGIGRSGLVAASYLVYSGWDPVNALTHVRSIRPGALESLGQKIVYEDFYTLLTHVDKQVLKQLINAIHSGYPHFYKHSSKTTQLLLELREITGGSEKDLEDLIYASILHDLDLNELKKTGLDKRVSSNVLELLDAYWSGEVGEYAVMLRIAHTLDKYRDSRVVVVLTEKTRSVVELTILYRSPINSIVEELSNLLKTLSRYTGCEYSVKTYSYMEYIW